MGPDKPGPILLLAGMLAGRLRPAQFTQRVGEIDNETQEISPDSHFGRYLWIDADHFGRHIFTRRGRSSAQCHAHADTNRDTNGDTNGDADAHSHAGLL